MKKFDTIYPVRIYSSISFLFICAIFLNCWDNPAFSLFDSTYGDVEISVELGRTVGLSKTSKAGALSVFMVKAILSAEDEETIRDSIYVADVQNHTVTLEFNGLSAPRKWSLAVITFDENRTILHMGKKKFSTTPGQTITVAMHLDALYSM